MKTIFIECRYKDKIELSDEDIKLLSEKIILASTIQYHDSLKNIKTQLEKSGKTVSLFQGKHQKYDGQILGCSIEKINEDGDLLYIGDGMFHPIAALMKNKDKEIFIYNPYQKKLSRLDKEYIKNYELKVKENLDKFYKSDNIGIIVSTKPGQNRLNDAESLKEKLIKKQKKATIFICNTLNYLELLNFPFVKCWVNTMCPRISFDDAMEIERPIVNIDELNIE